MSEADSISSRWWELQYLVTPSRALCVGGGTLTPARTDAGVPSRVTAASSHV